jgi:hypothetical protein
LVHESKEIDKGKKPMECCRGKYLTERKKRETNSYSDDISIKKRKRKRTDIYEYYL